MVREPRIRFALLALCCCATVTRAETGPRRVLESIEIVETETGAELRIRFGTPIRYLRHAPQGHGKEIQVEIAPIALSAQDPPALGISQSLPGPAGSPVPLVEVLYEGIRAGGGRSVIIRFARNLAFELRPGDDMRSLVVFVPREEPRPSIAPDPIESQAALPALAAPPDPTPTRAGGWAVQLRSAPRGSALPAPDSMPALDGASLYVVDFQKDGSPWQRLRVGRFETRRAAEVARTQLAAQFPGAFVIADATQAAGAAMSSPTPVAAGRETGSAALMDAARAALTSGDVDTAVRVLTKVLALPDHADSAEAKELLGLARERRGQFAHAKAEYEEYLARYPEGDGSTRVRQRLDALLTAGIKLPDSAAGAAVPPRTAPTLSILGSTGAWYRYESRHGDAGSQLADSSLLTDGTFVLRSQIHGWALRGQAAGSYLFDFAGGMGENETRVSSVFLDAKQLDGPWAGTVGRQPGNTTGVFSRFDGVRVTRRVADRWTVGALGGLPVEYWESGRFVETGRYLYGVSLDADHLFGKIDGQIFAVEQHTEDLLDRRAVGAEFRYADTGRFLSGVLDYDVYYASLNTALLVGNWQVAPATGLNLYADYRNSPTLTTTNAIIGQNVDRVDQLRSRYSTDQIESLAEDRTARSTMVSLGATQQLGDRFQVALDGSLSNLEGTPASGGVEASPGTGWEFSLYPQFVANGLLLGNDVGLLGLRWFHGDDADTYSLIATERLTVTRALRLIPRVRVDYRTRSGRDEFEPRADDPNSTLPAVVSATRVRNGQVTVRPFLGAEYRIGPVTLDTDCGVEWTTGSFDGGGSELSTILTFGVRYDF